MRCILKKCLGMIIFCTIEFICKTSYYLFLIKERLIKVLSKIFKSFNCFFLKYFIFALGIR
jgi:hypothetical protein